jgi:hypothetical protein
MIGAMRFPGLTENPILDVKFGFALMRDGRVPLRTKAAALLIGAAVTAIVESLELPIESILAVVLPFLGVAGDVAIDGVQALAGPIFISAALLPYLAPKDIVARLRAERATPTPGKNSPVVDV